ncbi:hypothetical protein NP233_g12281 [Leucocoprinus birnbaumii]|uniref:RNA 3'-terminal-phosphate cyclase (ATP) n=1 Tax=Leucocoprinus birnbaumii TaxID=56174 RepID=A0AAD5YKJ9_9AGAR|nr:hypothetical protein NP233_g12281 [Leucocoprinus birnbaumii]
MASAPSPLENGSDIQVIDGSVLEGGGQILRNTISLAGLLRKSIRIENIRHGRTKPGLKNQHRTGLQLAAEISHAKLTGASNGSTVIEFEPDKDKGIDLPGSWEADTVTAGSTTLLMQIALPLLLFRSSSQSGNGSSVLRLLGGTNAEQAPQIDYTRHIFIPFFRTHFLPLSSAPSSPSVELEIKKRGYFPKGGGELEVRVQPLEPGQKLRSVELVHAPRGRLVRVGGIAHYAGLPRVVGEGMRDAAVKMVRDNVRKGIWCPPGTRARIAPLSATISDGEEEEQEVLVDIMVRREPNQLTRGAGSGIVVWAEFENGAVLGGSAVGKKGFEPADVGRATVEELGKAIESGGCVDEWMQDQMIIFMALAEGRSEVRCGTEELSLHTKTAIWVAEQLTDTKFEVGQDESGHWIIRCDGVGFTMK